jgi:urate oxidase
VKSVKTAIYCQIGNILYELKNYNEWFEYLLPFYLENLGKIKNDEEDEDYE